MKIFQKWKHDPWYAPKEQVYQIKAKSKISRLPQSFSPVLDKNSPQGPENENEKKEKTPRYSPKEQVYQISAKSDHFWGLQAALKF